MSRTSRFAIVGTGAAMAVALAGCGSSGTSNSSSDPSGSAGTKTLTVATDATYPPLEFIGPDGKTIEGIDPDIIRAIGAKMGVKINLVQSNFGGLVPALAAGKFDMAISGIADTKEREKTVNMVDYLGVPQTFIMNKASGKMVTSLDGLCGLKIAVQAGSVVVPEAEAQKQKCGGNLTVLAYPDQQAATLALTSGRADVSLAAGPVAAYLVDQNKNTLTLGGTIKVGENVSAIIVPKNQPELANQVLNALKTLIADGTYKKILDKWHSGMSAITDPKINGATS